MSFSILKHILVYSSILINTLRHVQDTTLVNYQKHIFTLDNQPPLTGLLDYFLCTIIPYKILYFIKCCVLSSLLSNSIVSLVLFLINLYTPSYCAIFILLACKKKSVILKGVFFGFALVSDLSASFYILITILSHVYFTYMKLIDKNLRVSDTLYKCVNYIYCCIIISMCIYCSIFYLDYTIRPNILNYKNVPLEFYSTFKTNLQPQNVEVTHNSLITLINKHHKQFMTVQDGSVSGTPFFNEFSVWQIQKVNRKGRVSPNDLIRILNVSTGKYLCLNKINQKDNFFNLDLSFWKEIKGTNNELFRIESKDLECRNTPLQIINHNTGLPLGMRKLSSSNINCYASAYSNKLHRIFYISHNKTQNSDVHNVVYPSLNFIQKVFVNTVLLINRIKLDSPNLLGYGIFIVYPIYCLLFSVLNTRIYNKKFQYKFIELYLNFVFLHFVFCGDSSYKKMVEIQLIVSFIQNAY